MENVPAIPGELYVLVQALEEIARTTQEIHRQDETRLFALIGKVERHGEILQQYLIHRDSWEKTQAEFTGPKSLYVQLSALAHELAAAKEQVLALKEECATELKELVDRKADEKKFEVQRQIQHDNNQAKIKTAYVSAFLAAVTSIGLALIELLKK